MNKDIVTSRDIKIEKSKFHYHKNPILTDDIDIEKILITNKMSCKRGYKYFIGYKCILFDRK